MTLESKMLDTRLRLTAPDDFYEALIALHQGLEAPASHALNARLVLLLANQIGDQEALLAVLRAARGSVASTAPSPIAPAAAVAPVHAQG